MSESQAQKHSGGCHCGKVRYDVELDLSAPVISCNCSMCGRSGTLLSFVPEGKVTLRSGEDGVADYLFNRHAIHHLFCKTCGIKPFARGKKADGTAMVAITVRCLDDVDLYKLAIHKVDGKSAPSAGPGQRPPG
jgi:hypothetical protein